jgi:hypothetical protein
MHSCSIPPVVGFGICEHDKVRVCPPLRVISCLWHSNITIYNYSFFKLYCNEESSYFVDCNVVALPNFSVYYNGTFIRSPRKIFQAMASIPSLREAHKFYNISVKPCVSVNSANIFKCLQYSYHLLDTRAICIWIV